jgi:hypothetical protein
MQTKEEQRAQNLQMITQWKESGLSQKSFCTANNIAYHIFHYWYGVYRSKKATTNLFVPLNIVPVRDLEQITITGVNGIEIHLTITDQSIHFVKQLLLS